MLNISILMGSPRKNGNTSLMAERLLEQLEPEAFVVDDFYLQEMNIKPCNDCRACKAGDFVCTVRDDMQAIYQSLENSDVIVFGTPIYWFTPSAQMKGLIDRLRPYYKNGKLQAKKAVLLLPAGTGAGDCDLTIEMYKRVFSALGIKYLGAATAKAYDEGDVLKDEDAMRQIDELAAAIKS